VAANKGLAGESIVASGIHTVGTNILQVFGSFALAALVARSLGPDGKGSYDLYMTTVTLLSTLLGMALTSGITYVVASSAVNVRRLERVIGIVALTEGLAAALLIGCFKGLPVVQVVVPSALAGSAAMLIAFGVAAVGLSSMYRAFLAGRREFIAANYGDLTKQAVGLLFAGGAVVLALNGHLPLLMALVAANILSVIVAAIVYFSWIRVEVPERTMNSGLRRCIAYAIPSYLGTLVQFLNYRLDVFFVSAISGTGALGIYQAAVVLAQSLSLLPGAAQAVLFPTVASSSVSHAEVAARVARANRLLMLAGVVSGVLLLLFAPWGVSLVFGASFQAGAKALMWLVPGSVIFTTNTVLAGYFAGVGRPRVNLVVACIGLLITIPLDIILIPRSGIVGAAIASSASYAASAIAIGWLFIHETGVSIRRLLVADRQDLRLIRGKIADLVRQGFPGSRAR
jgi:O-antigen/teichoic acid export membrane protein